MTTGYLATTLVLLVTALAIASGWLYGHLQWKDGHEAGRLYERNRQSERRIRANQDQGRARPPAASPAGGQPPWYTVVTPTRLVRGGIGGPSTVPIPHRHAPRLPVLLTDTGEFRQAAVAGTDLFIASMQADEENYRRSMRQEISA